MTVIVVREVADMAFLVAYASKHGATRGYRRVCGGDAGEELKLPAARAMLPEGADRHRRLGPAGIAEEMGTIAERQGPDRS